LEMTFPRILLFELCMLGYQEPAGSVHVFPIITNGFSCKHNHAVQLCLADPFGVSSYKR
jgi:hypothetical protein